MFMVKKRLVLRLTVEKKNGRSIHQMVELQKNSHIRSIDGESSRFIIE
jgi:hypothetical protein